MIIHLLYHYMVQQLYICTISDISCERNKMQLKELKKQIKMTIEKYQNELGPMFFKDSTYKRAIAPHYYRLNKRNIRKCVEKYGADVKIIEYNNIFNMTRRREILDDIKKIKIDSNELCHIIHDNWLIPFEDSFDMAAFKKDVNNKFRDITIDYLLFIEFTLINKFGRLYLSPHLHGFLFSYNDNDVKRVRKRFVHSNYGLMKKKIVDKNGAIDYLLKPCTSVTSYFEKDGRMVNRMNHITLRKQFDLIQRLQGVKFHHCIIYKGEKGRKIGRRLIKKIGQNRRK